MRAKQIKIKKEVSVLYIAPKSVDEYWALCEFNLIEGLKSVSYTHLTLPTTPYV